MSIEVSQLLKVYGEQKAINDISFTIKKGEITGFLGPNGAGKSTTMKIITGYLLPDSGNAKVCGLDVSKYPIEVKKKIGYLPESNPLYYEMYVKEYLGFVATVHKTENRKQKIEAVIELTGLQIEQHKKIGQLSKGYKQRVGLAVSLVHDPEVLILDEPTNGLDPNQIIEIRNIIKEQGKSKTVLFSSHILQEVQAICDRVIIINKGGIVADDTIENLQQNNKNHIVKITFKEAIDISGLQQVTSATDILKENAYSWKLISANTSETRKQLLQLAVEQNLNVVSLQTEGNSLEEIFSSLTQNEN
jgi:ABC-2 type transport system ATP-binding protein